MSNQFVALALFLSIVSCKKQVSKTHIQIVEELSSPAGQNSVYPFIFPDESTLNMSWVEKVDDSLAVLYHSQMGKGGWQEPKEITRGTDWFVNWADFPSIVTNQGNSFSHILQKSSSGTYSYDVKVNLKPNGKDTWETGLKLHTDETPTEHGFVTALPYEKNDFFVTWLDGRNTEENENGERGAMTIRAAEVDAATGIVKNDVVLDNRVCDCCQTTAAITKDGPVVIYRDRSEGEIRDISIVRKEPEGWTEPMSVHADNWNINGCPVNGPKAAVFENTLGVVWFTGANDEPTVKLSFSNDNGKNFDSPIEISRDSVIGRVDLLLIDEKTALVSYMEATGKTAQLKVVKATRLGKLSTPVVVCTLDASRKTGFPQMELWGEKVYFAWTDYHKKQTAIKIAAIELNHL